MIVAVGLVVLFLLLIFGMPVAFALGVAGMVGLYLKGGLDIVLGILRSTPLSATSSYELITVPMFMLMAEFIIVSRIADELFDSAKVWLGRTPAGLAISTALAGAGFGAISGSSTAAAATLSGTSIPAMIRHNYNPRLASGVVAISGTLAMLIPPSIAIVLYGLIAQVSISRLLIAGIIPGLLVTIVITLTVLALAAINPSHAPAGSSYSLREKLASLRIVGPMIALIMLVTGCIYLGIATPTEAASLGAFGAMVIAAIRRRLTWDSFCHALFNASRTTCMIVLIIICAQVFGYYFTLTGFTQDLVSYVADLDVSRWVIFALIVLLYLVLGCFLDQVAILFLTVPIVLPVVTALGFDPIWFGIIVIITAEVGLVTPPVGLNVYVVAAYSKIPVKDIFIGVAPHVLAHMLVILLLAMFPALILWLPSTIVQ
ncbi:MAG TPA: TRAP transporter large permease subunit [Ferrovibrio sp.]|uniref:TRAP transporter large permease n=1 Tax=Ferrovibrio sp. TaxID=1917215 RepID=UPI002B4B0BAF|nr:TRAP transporter large permease subunit [Ferrovibrio sp.]HLT77395.1 TRAP transporter large permease subunit [Ferrovibrio sp.]